MYLIDMGKAAADDERVFNEERDLFERMIRQLEIDDHQRGRPTVFLVNN